MEIMCCLRAHNTQAIKLCVSPSASCTGTTNVGASVGGAVVGAPVGRAVGESVMGRIVMSSAVVNCTLRLA